jgi:hypothetical protein
MRSSSESQPSAAFDSRDRVMRGANRNAFILPAVVLIPAGAPLIV